MHSLGKNIVAMMLRATGFEVHDLGVDVKGSVFIQRAQELKADIIGLSCLMTTTLPYQREVLEDLQAQGLRDRFKVMVGGGPVTEEWAEEIGADGYGRDVIEAVQVAKVLTGIAALAAFGPAHRFSTEVLVSGQPDHDGAVDALFIRGGGDPTLTSEQWWRLSADLRIRGLRRVRGDLFMDDTLFDGERWHPSWGEVTSRAYHAPVGALSANYGAFFVAVAAASEPGGPVRVAALGPGHELGVAQGYAGVIAPQVADSVNHTLVVVSPGPVEPIVVASPGEEGGQCGRQPRTLQVESNPLGPGED